MQRRIERRADRQEESGRNKQTDRQMEGGRKQKGSNRRLLTFLGNFPTKNYDTK